MPSLRLPPQSYRSVFILLFTALLVLTTLAVAANAYRRAAQASLELSGELIARMSETVADRTRAILEQAYAYLETNALVVPAQGLGAEREQVFRLFWKQLELSPELLSIYAADPSGGFIQVRNEPQPVTRFIERGAAVREGLVYRSRDYAPIAHVAGDGSFDPRERAWYREAIAVRGQVAWSSVHRFADVQKAGIGAARAVFGPDGQPVLVLGVEIALAGLSELLAKQSLAKGGIAAIVDGRDALVAHPHQLALRPRGPNDPSKAPPDALPGIDDLADPALVAAYRTLKAAPPGATTADRDTRSEQGIALLGGERYIARLHRFPSPLTEGWQLFVAVPQASLLTGAARLLSETAVISLIILAVAVALLSWLALRLFNPLDKLVRNTERVRAMRLAEVEPVHSRFTEIRAMDGAIRDMAQGLRALEKFVPAALARGLIESGSGAQAKPGLQLAPLTLLCGGLDAVGGLCRGLPPETVAAVLAAQLERFTRVLLRERATVDDYLGESLLAFWGAPTPAEDGPIRACVSALRCLQAEAEQLAEDDAIPAALVQNSYAVHAGSCLVGNVGSQRYLTYTALGEHVELVRRIKGLNRVYGTRVIVTGAVRDALSDAFWLRRLDLLAAPGSGEPLALFELQGERAGPLPAEDRLFARAYERGLDALAAGDWAWAERTFEALLAERPRDPSVRLMHRRSQARTAMPCTLADASGLSC